MAALLALTLFSTQAFGQQLSSQFPDVADTSADTSVRTIRLAQNGTGASNLPVDIDIDPPAIDHESLETGVPGQAQRFKALVVDDQGLKHVKLFYRDRSGVQYSSVDMEQVDSSSEYSVVIETSLGQTRIEYYIEALDTGGNRVLKGFPFFPLVRQLEPAPGSTTQVTEEAAPESRIIYVLLGVAALGLAIALLGDDSDPPVTQPPGTVPLNIIVTPP